MSELTDKLRTEAQANKGTDLGCILQWAALHIEAQDEALADKEAEYQAAAKDAAHMHARIKAISAIVDNLPGMLMDAHPVNEWATTSRDYSSHANVSAYQGDKNYGKPNKPRLAKI
jgi:hypothetical protein